MEILFKNAGLDLVEVATFVEKVRDDHMQHFAIVHSLLLLGVRFNDTSEDLFNEIEMHDLCLVEVVS